MSNISPKLQKGAILTFDPNTGVKLGTIMLQYNPDTLDSFAQAAIRRR